MSIAILSTLIINIIQESCIHLLLTTNKSFSLLLDVLPKTFLLLKTFNLELSHVEVWFADQNSKPLDMEGKINITLAIN